MVGMNKIAKHNEIYPPIKKGYLLPIEIVFGNYKEYFNKGLD